MLIRVLTIAICAASLIAGAGTGFSQTPASLTPNPDHPAQSQRLHVSKGDPQASNAIAEDVTNHAEKSYGAESIDAATSLTSAQSMTESARSYMMKGNFSVALPLAREALNNIRKMLDNYGSVQAEQSQLKLQDTVRPALDTYISAAIGAHVDPTEIYSSVLAWKGATTARQRWMRAARDDLKNNQDAVKLYSELESKSRALSSAYNAIVPRDQRESHKQMISKLSDDVDGLQLKVSQVSQSFRAAREAARCTPADLQNVLPSDAALVDILEMLFTGPGINAEPNITSQKRMLAFIVRHDRPVELVDLGPSDRVQVAVVLWRVANLPKELKSEEHADADRMKKEWDATIGKSAMPEYKLCQWVWKPLAAHLEGCNTVLVAPDGALCYFPWGAFPGEQAGSYLLEERTLAVVPVPQLLPEILAQPSHAGDPDFVPSMLLVGNVHVNSDPGAPNESSQTAAARQPNQVHEGLGYMPGTTDDIESIRELFKRAMPNGFAVKLTGDQPTEQAFRGFAPRSTYIHLAVHGYYEADRLSGRRYRRSLDEHLTPFANEDDVSQAHPDLLCGLAFVGATAIATADKDDGIMTGLELAALNLDHTELVTLTSCQSALGTGAAGEGVLGIQRAFQVAGAHSTIATLWSVGIDPTDQLMIDFYKNLWVKKLSRVEALRQAQLKMLREGSQRFGKSINAKRTPSLDAKTASDVKATVNKKTSPGTSTTADAKPSLTATSSPQSDNPPARLPPFYWAAFVLAGDWR